MRGRRLSLEKKKRLLGIGFVSPWVIGFLVFMVYPLLTSLYLSVGKVTDLLGLRIQYIGFAHYRELFTSDVQFLPAFWETAKTTFLWTPFIIVFSLVVAILLNRKIRFRGLFRTLYFLPVLLGAGFVMERLGAGAIEKFMVLPEDWIQFIGAYLSDGVAELFAGIAGDLLSIFWRSGVQIVIFLAGLQAYPTPTLRRRG